MNDGASIKTWNYKKIVIIISLLLLVWLTLTLFLNRDRLTFAHFTRAIHYRNLGTAALAEEFHFSSLARNTFAILGDGLAVASGSGLTIYDRTGSQVYAAISPLERPVIRTAGNFALAYDLGGRNLQLGTPREALWQGEAEGPIIDARVNENGWVTVSAEQAGTLGIVRVYDPRGVPTYHVWAREGHLIGAALAADNRTLVVLTMTEVGGRVAWFYTDVDADEAEYVYLEEGEIFIDLWFTARSGSVGVISSNMVRFLSNTGEPRGEHRFPDRQLLAYDIDGANVALYLSSHAGDELLLLGPSGTQSEIQVSGNLFDISLSGRYLAALFFDELVIYRGGSVYARWDETEGMNRVLVRDDGTLFRLSAHRARLLVP